MGLSSSLDRISIRKIPLEISNGWLRINSRNQQTPVRIRIGPLYCIKEETMEKEILINQSVAILCDGNNVERSIHELSKNTSTMINFDKLIPKLLNGRGLNRFIYFREGKNISSKLAERLYDKYYGSVVPCHKSADIPLSIKATQLASKVDTIVIMSGDSDYVELVRHLKSEGVRVEIAAVKDTTARILVDECDHFHPITREHWFEYNSRSRTVRKPADKTAAKSPAKPEVAKKVVAKPAEKKS
jgi:hypothetical protein